MHSTLLHCLTAVTITLGNISHALSSKLWKILLVTLVAACLLIVDISTVVTLPCTGLLALLLLGCQAEINIKHLFPAAVIDSVKKSTLIPAFAAMFISHKSAQDAIT